MGAWSHLGRGHALGATLDSRVTVQRLDSTLGLSGEPGNVFRTHH